MAMRPRSVSISLPLLQRAQQHHGAGHRQRQAEHQSGAQRPAKRPGQAQAEQRRENDLRDRAGDGDRPHRQQVLQREMHADAEHQEDDADLRQFRRQRLIGDEARRVRSNGHAGQQIAHQRRHLQPMGDRAEDERQHDADDDRGDERRVMQNWSP